MRLRALTVVMGVALVALVACSDDGDDEDSTDSTATLPAVTAVASPETPDSADETPDVSSGIPEVDDIVVAVLSGDPAKVRPRVRYTSGACVFAEGPGGSSPPCRQGETEGTEVDYVTLGTCEGEFRRPDEIDGLVEMFLANGLFGVYAGPASQGPDGDYIAVFTRDAGGTEGALAVTIDGGIMVYFKFGCTETPDELVDLLGLGEPLLVTP